ncbi:hypothetical protein BDU57DRAFT_530392 [Ampelomyces quisqualis]|uniref:Uncharacterized protein n=1 Tax=Ampelomyces quisqualis TaxID=50730 RepID=A0A6A5QKQ0_AMPQU|nr:hypothetical protein BDU57DRAFT_530392 [Ampelomyces quisqualis]
MARPASIRIDPLDDLKFQTGYNSLSVAKALFRPISGYLYLRSLDSVKPSPPFLMYSPTTVNPTATAICCGLFKSLATRYTKPCSSAEAEGTHAHFFHAWRTQALQTIPCAHDFQLVGSPDPLKRFNSTSAKAMSIDISKAAPVFHSLSQTQKRALVLRDNLRWLDPRHLDTFIEGLNEYEPPAYKRVNGTTVPPLMMVSLKEYASRFDLGNVEFYPSDKGMVPGVYHAYLTVEDGAFEMRTEKALPEDDAVLESLPIHSFIAGGMLAFFETKFKAIWARMKQINEMRQVAYGMVENEPADEFVQGETLAVFDSEPTTTTQGGPSATAHRKRRPNSPIAQHVSNKRTHIGLATIPASSKAEVFNAIPSAIKVDIFNNVVKTAFPNFDNLMMAAWNVVSVYSNVGTDFPELHRSIVELKSVLQDFEEGSGKKVVRGAPEFRRDFAPQEGGEQEQDMPDAPQDGAGDTTGGGEQEDEPTQQDNIEAQFNDADPKPEHPLPTSEMPPPRTPHRQTNKTNARVHSDTYRTITFRSSPSPRPTPHPKPPTTSREPSREPSHDETATPRRRPDYHSSSPLFTSPGPTTTSAPPTSVQDAADKHPKSLAALSTPALRTMYKSRKTDLIARFGGNANVPQAYRVQMQELRREIREREEREREQRAEGEDRGHGNEGGGGGGKEEDDGGMLPMFLGKSVLGGKKNMGMAPVAPMVHTKKNGAVGGGVKRKFGGGE